MILELKDICKDYLQGKMVIPVLKHIDFQMEQGEYVAIMGESGSGKTTLLNILAALDRPTSGDVWIRRLPASFFWTGRISANVRKMKCRI